MIWHLIQRMMAELRLQVAVDDLELEGGDGSHRTPRLLWEGVMIVAAITTVALYRTDTPTAHAVQWGIWALFLGDYAVRLAVADDRGRFVRYNVIDLLAIIPFDLARGLRILRVFRLVRATVVAIRVLRNVRGLLAINHTGATLVVAGGLIVLGGVAAAEVEPEIEGVWNGVWYAIVTTTTVGYGDYFPVTVPGRLIAILLMFTGIGVVAAIGGAIATWAVELARKGPTADTDPDHPDVAHTITRLTRWDDLSVDERTRLADLLAQLARDPTTGPEALDVDR